MKKHFGGWMTLMVLMAAAAGPATTQSSKVSAKRALQQVLPEVRVNKVTLDQMAKKLQELSGATITVDWANLEGAGVNRDAVMSAALQKVKLAQVLSMVVSNFAQPNAKLAYGVDDATNSIIISTEKQLDGKLVPMTYDVAWFIDQSKGSGAAKAQLIQAIETAIAPATWKGHGGLGTIQFQGKSIVVINAQRVQEKIPALLEQLKSAGTKK